MKFPPSSEIVASYELQVGKWGLATFCNKKGACPFFPFLARFFTFLFFPAND